MLDQKAAEDFKEPRPTSLQAGDTVSFTGMGVVIESRSALVATPPAERVVEALRGALDFVNQASGAMLGIAMSGDSHPNPDGVLMDLSRKGMDLASRLSAALAAKPAVKDDERVTLTADDAKTLIGVIEEFYVHNELSREEVTAFLNLCNSGNFGRPVVKGRRRTAPAAKPAVKDDETVVEALRNFRTWFAEHFEDFDDATNMQLLCLDNEAEAALAATDGRS